MEKFIEDEQYKKDELHVRITYTWRDALRQKATVISNTTPFGEATLGYKILWYLWSADIWFGEKFPLLKFIMLMNVLVWVILFVL